MLFSLKFDCWSYMFNLLILFYFKYSLQTSPLGLSSLYNISPYRDFRKCLEIHCGHGFGLLTMTIVNPTSVFLETLGHMCQTTLDVINLNTKKKQQQWQWHWNLYILIQPRLSVEGKGSTRAQRCPNVALMHGTQAWTCLTLYFMERILVSLDHLKISLLELKFYCT